MIWRWVTNGRPNSATGLPIETGLYSKWMSATGAGFDGAAAGRSREHPENSSATKLAKTNPPWTETEQVDREFFIPIEMFLMRSMVVYALQIATQFDRQQIMDLRAELGAGDSKAESFEQNLEAIQG